MKKLLLTSLFLLILATSALCAVKTVDIKLPYGYLDETDSEHGISKLALSSLFYGTKNYTAEKIHELLSEVDNSLSPLPHILPMPHATTIRFYVAETKIPLFMPLAEEMASTKEFSHTQVERARAELMTEAAESLEGEEQKNALRALSGLTPTQVQKITDLPIIVTVSDEESSIQETSYSPQTRSKIVIGGKITMNEPELNERRFEGYLISGALFALTVGTAFLSYLFPPLVFLPFCTLATTIYFGADNYYNDPAVIQELRSEDLAKGFHHAYKKGRAAYTLTPFERRCSFLAEGTKSSDFFGRQLADYPIATLADLYNLSDPILLKMFTSEELNFLKLLKDDFVLSRNRFFGAKGALDKELNSLLTPYLAIKNIALDNARHAYEINPHITTMRALKKEWDAELKAINETFQADTIDLETRDAAVLQVNSFYDEALRESDLAEGIQEAKDHLEKEQKLAILHYETKVSECKDVINFEVRTAQIEAGLTALYEQHNEPLRNYLTNLPLNEANFDDFIDRS